MLRADQQSTSANIAAYEEKACCYQSLGENKVGQESVEEGEQSCLGYTSSAHVFLSRKLNDS